MIKLLLASLALVGFLSAAQGAHPVPLAPPMLDASQLSNGLARSNALPTGYQADTLVDKIQAPVSDSGALVGAGFGVLIAVSVTLVAWGLSALIAGAPKSDYNEEAAVPQQTSPVPTPTSEGPGSPGATELMYLSVEPFSRKQLAYMGLFVLAAFMVAVNWEPDYSDAIVRRVAAGIAGGGYSGNGGLAAVALNVAAVVLGWFARVSLGRMFAVVFGTLLTGIAAIVRRV